ILQKALKEKHPRLAVAAIDSLGDRAAREAKKPNYQGRPALVKALYDDDPRVALAAARALLRIPGKPAPNTTKRIIDVLARALSPMVAMKPGGSKVLVAVGDGDWRRKVADSVRDLGFIPVSAGTGKEAMKKLRASNEFECVLMESTLPMPGLAHT